MIPGACVAQLSQNDIATYVFLSSIPVALNTTLN